METMKILFIEENAPDYLKIRQMLDAQNLKFNMDYSQNYEVASKQIQTNSYDVCLISYDPIKNQHLAFLASLPADFNTPIILLLNNNDPIDKDLTKKSQIDWLYKEGLNWAEIERSIHYLSLEQQLANCNLYDRLTELPTRHLFLQHLEQAITSAQQNEDYYIAILLVNLKKFRMINASLGHDMGDWLLMEITRRLQDYLSELEMKTFLARACGDEFIILLDNMQDLADATQLAANINELLARPLSLVGYELVTSAKIGIAYYSDQDESASLLRDADAALYRVKAMEHSSYAVFNRGMRNKVVSRLKMETDLHQAIKNEKFVLFYHPQINLASNELVAMEALIRFYHPQTGLVLPNEFIPVLEETGDIIPIGEWILRTACQQLKDWWLAGFLINRICVNLSSYQFRSKNLIRAVVESIESAGLEPDCLELEVTESLLLEDANFAIKTLKHLRDIGVRVAIDNFGTGYASLNYLKRFPADCLKIENSFIQGGTPQDAAITIATIDLAHALGLFVIGEGVETTEQSDFLRDQACDFAQGYLYTVPLNRTESLEWIEEYAKKYITPL
jgi:diguanylate cyclase (GGDEF)-like protein